MSDYVIPAPPQPSLAVRGTRARFPVRRIFCVGRNFAEHAREMGASIDRGQPVFFTKPADAVLPGGGPMAYPLATTDLHHEVELVVALGQGSSGVVPVVHGTWPRPSSRSAASTVSSACSRYAASLPPTTESRPAAPSAAWSSVS